MSEAAPGNCIWTESKPRAMGVLVTAQAEMQSNEIENSLKQCPDLNAGQVWLVVSEAICDFSDIEDS